VAVSTALSTFDFRLCGAMSKRFVFRLEAALRQRLREEQAVQVALARAAGARAAAAAELARREDELASANRMIVGLDGAFDPGYRMNALYYIERQRQAVWQQEALVARVDGEVARIRELLLAAALQRRALEKLKERQESRFRADMMQKMERDIDELTTARYVRPVTTGGAQ